jgi:GlpG protein
MRIISTYADQKKAQELSAFLTSEGIENQLDVAVDNDWGSPTYGDVSCKLWIYDEDKVDEAERWLALYEKEPNNPVFLKTSPISAEFALRSPTGQKEENSIFNTRRPPKNYPESKSSSAIPLSTVTGKITFYLILLCTALLLYSEATTPAFIPYPASLPPIALFSSPIKKKTLYDYPYAFDLVDKTTRLYGIEKLQMPDELPNEGKFLLKQFAQTPYWQGFYEPTVQQLKNGVPLSKSLETPMFEKIREGEIWRLFTPVLMHSDILHLLFNMLWLIILGRQLEQRLGGTRYILFIFLTGIFSNTAQYLMSGSNFVGFSGVICAMLTFIWLRKRQAPWEGYQLEKMTMIFMAFFILAMLAIQLVSFWLEASGHEGISPGIANTAHLTGALIGFLFGYLPFFKWRQGSTRGYN